MHGHGSCIFLDNKTNANEFRKVLQKVLDRKYAFLRRAMQYCLEDVAAELFSNGFITRPVRNAPSYNAIICEFEAGIQLKENISELSKHCQLFVKSVIDGSEGGSAYLAAQSLAEEWNDEANKFQVTKQPAVKIESPSVKFEISPQIITKQTPQFNSEDQVETDLQLLHDQFQVLVHSLKKQFEELINRNEYRVENIIEDVNQFIADNEKMYKVTSFEELFLITGSNFLSCELLQYLVDRFLPGTAVHTQLEEYAIKLEKFKRCSMIQFIRNAFERITLVKSHRSQTNILAIKLEKEWAKKTLENLDVLLQHLFSRKAHLLQLHMLEEGSILVQFLFYEPHAHLFVNSLKSTAREHFLQCIGVLEISVADKFVIRVPSRLENTPFGFECSLLDEVQSCTKYSESLQFLLELANVDFENGDGKTALMLAIECGNEQAVQALIFSGANLNKSDKSGFTAIMLACQKNHTSIVDLLSSAGADVHAKRSNGSTAFFIASYYGHTAVVEMLIKLVDKNAKNNDGVTALAIASQNGHAQTVERLLMEGTDPDLQTNNGFTALMLASRDGKVEVADLLLKNSANPDV